MKVGDTIEDFQLENQFAKTVTLTDTTKSYFVLFFYPKDNTPGCTIEAKAFSQLLDDFEKEDTIVIGISGGDTVSKQKFCDKQDLQVTLVSDTDYTYTKKLGLYTKKKFMGKEYMGIERTTVILDSQRIILHIFDSVKPLGHAKEVLEWIKTHKN